jgi:hypothetical protein
VSYGFSLSELGDEGVDGAVHHIGVGFDVSPDLAVVAGASFFDLDDALDGGEHDQAFFLGVALNLNAFRYMFSAKPEFTTAAGLPEGR